MTLFSFAPPKINMGGRNASHSFTLRGPNNLKWRRTHDLSRGHVRHCLPVPLWFPTRTSLFHHLLRRPRRRGSLCCTGSGVLREDTYVTVSAAASPPIVHTYLFRCVLPTRTSLFHHLLCRPSSRVPLLYWFRRAPIMFLQFVSKRLSCLSHFLSTENFSISTPW